MTVWKPTRRNTPHLAEGACDWNGFALFGISGDFAASSEGSGGWACAEMSSAQRKLRGEETGECIDYTVYLIQHLSFVFAWDSTVRHCVGILDASCL